MIYLKTFETYIDLSNNNDIYTINLTKTLLHILNNTIVGKCFKSSYIMEITRIIKHSEIYMSYELDGSAYVCIQFECKVLIYHKGEVIVDCLIKKIESNNQIHAESKYANIQIKNAELAPIKENDISPVIVNMVKYIPGKHLIAVMASPFIPIQTDVIMYKIINTDGNNDKWIEEQEMNISKLEANLASQSADVFKFFKSLLTVESKNTNKINLKDIKSLKSGVLYRDISCKYLSKCLYVQSVDQPTVVQSLDNIYKILLVDYEKELKIIQTLCQTYSTMQKINNNSKIWNTYNIYKRSLFDK